MKKVAKSLTGMLSDPLMAEILDRGSSVMELVPAILDDWSYNLLERKPGPAVLEDGTFVGTDLDLLFVIQAIAKIKSWISIPEDYKPMRQSHRREGETHFGGDRRGRVLGVAANKDVFSFSARMPDKTVMNDDGSDAYRSFALTGLSGEFHKGLGTITFNPPEEWKQMIKDRKLEHDPGSIQIKYPIHPARAGSYFGKPHMRVQALLTRCEEEMTWYGMMVKRMVGAGVKYPDGKSGNKKEWGKTTPSSDSKKIKVPAFESMLYIPGVLPHPVLMAFPQKKVKEKWSEWYNRVVDESSAISDTCTWFPNYENSTENLVMCKDHYRYLRYTAIPDLRFIARGNQLAYLKYGEERLGPNKFPHWIKNAAWEDDFVFPGKRAKYKRLVLFQEKPGMYGISLVHRRYEKSEKVHPDYELGEVKWCI